MLIYNITFKVKKSYGEYTAHYILTDFSNLRMESVGRELLEKLKAVL